MKLIFDFIFASLIILATIAIYFIVLQNIGSGIMEINNFESGEFLSNLCKDVYFITTTSKLCDLKCSNKTISENIITNILKPYVNSYLATFRYYIVIYCFCKNNSITQLVKFGDKDTIGISSSIIIPTLNSKNAMYIKIYLRVET